MSPDYVGWLGKKVRVVHGGTTGIVRHVLLGLQGTATPPSVSLSVRYQCEDGEYHEDWFSEAEVALID